MKDSTLLEGKSATGFFSGIEGVNFKKWIKPLFIFILFAFFSGLNNLSAQTTDPDGYPGNILRASHCPANDLEVFDALLEGADNCIDCSSVTKYPLKLGVRNKTGSTRTSFSFWAILETTNLETGVTTREAIKGCNGPISGKGEHYLTFGEIEYSCGTTLRLVDIYMAYTDASGNDSRKCGEFNEEGQFYEPVDPNTISPKCGVSEDIAVRTPLSASSSIVNVTCFGDEDGSVTIGASGGTSFNDNLPRYEIDFDGAGYVEYTVPKTFTGLSSKTYNWTVRDANNCTQTGMATVGEPKELTVSISSTNVTCYNDGDGVVSIGTTTGDIIRYELYKDSGTTAVASNTTGADFTGLVPGDYYVKVFGKDGE
ncbi:SprB repeat-containing protein, partial [Salegentibacter chungangensis]